MPTSTARPTSNRTMLSRLTNGASRLVWHCLALMFVGWVLGGVWWGFDLASHFWPFYAVLLALAAGWLLVRRRWRDGGVAAAALLLNLTAILPYYLPATSPQGTPLRLVVCNLFSGNPTPSQALDFLEASDADVLVLLEVDPDWAERLQSLRTRYPHGWIVPQEGNFGIALLSRQPLRDMEQINFGLSGVPTLTAVLVEADVRIVATHPLPPINGRFAARRDVQLADIARYCADSPRPVLVAGDLNATPWSGPFRDLVHSGRLRDSSHGHGLQPTWPTLGPIALLPIDHVLVSSELGVRQRTVGPAIGSDHRPVVVDMVARR